MNRAAIIALLVVGTSLAAFLGMKGRAPEQPLALLAKGWFRVPSGTVYLSNGDGHVCGYASWGQYTNAGGSAGAWTQLDALPKGTIDDGVCGATKVPSAPLPKGWFRIPSGTVYLSNGDGHVCGYASWEQFTNAGGSSGAWTQLAALPKDTIDDGVCGAAQVPMGPLPKGWFRIPSGTVYLSNGDGHVCGYASWEQFTNAGGSAGAWTQLSALPKDTIDDGVCGAAQVPMGPLPKGWFRIPSGTVYLSNGDGHVCGYASWEQFTNAGGSAGAWTQLDALPKDTIDDGVCGAQKQPLASGFVRLARATLLRSDGEGHLCRYDTWDDFTAAGGKNGAWEEVVTLPAGNVVTGPCELTAR